METCANIREAATDPTEQCGFGACDIYARERRSQLSSAPLGFDSCGDSAASMRGGGDGGGFGDLGAGSLLLLPLLHWPLGFLHGKSFFS